MVCEGEEDNLKRLRRQVDGLAALQANSDLRISGNAESGLWHELMQDRLNLVRRLSDASVDRKIRLIGRWYTAGLVGPSQLVEAQLLRYPECSVRELWLEIVGAEPGDLSDAAAEELRWQEELDRQDSSGKREQRTIDDLDQHILKHVLSFIDEEQLAPVRLVSRAFRNACSTLLTQVCVSTLPQLKSLTRDFPQLRALEIEVLEPASVKYLNSFVKAVNKNLPRLGHSLETLTLNLSICLSSQSIGDAVASLSNLRQLQLLDASDLEPWVAISQCMPKLASLRLQISDATSDTQRLLEQVAPKLDALTLIGFAPTCPPGLFAALPNLQSLCLHSQFSALPDTLAEAVAGCPSLTSLSLLDTTANIDFARNLLEALALRCTRQPLQELRLELDEMGHESLAEMTASTWARLQPLSSLTTLSCLRLGTVSRSSVEPYVFFDPGLWSIMPASLRVVHIERSVGGFPEPSHDSLIEELQSGRFRQLAELQGVSLDIPHFRSGIFNEQAMTWEPLTTLTSLGAGLLLLADQPEPLPEAGAAPLEQPLLEQQQQQQQPPQPQQPPQQQEPTTPPPPPPPPDLKEQVALAVGNAFWAGGLIRTMAPQLQELSLTLPTIADLGVQVQDVLSALLRPLEGLAQLHSLSLDIWPPQEDQADAPPAEGEPREEPLALKNLVPLLDRLATWPQLRRLRLESVAGGDMAGPYVSLKRKHLGLPYCHVVSSNGYDSDYSNDDD